MDRPSDGVDGRQGPRLRSAPDGTVNIVDDDPSVRTSLTRLMRSAGYPAQAFASGEEYLDHAVDAPVGRGCLILDLHLPGMSGLEVQEHLNRRHLPMPVIVLTASREADLCARALAAGAAKVLRKPCDSTVLLGAVAEVFQPSSPPAPPAGGPPAHLTTKSGESSGETPGSNDPDHYAVERGCAVYRPEGSVSFDQAVFLVRAAIAVTRMYSVPALLVDTTAWSGFPSPDTFERFLAVVEWAEEASGGVRLAMVARADMIHPQKFGVLVAANRGLVSNIFTNEAEARAWLGAWDGQ